MLNTLAVGGMDGRRAVAFRARAARLHGAVRPWAKCCAYRVSNGFLDFNMLLMQLF